MPTLRGAGPQEHVPDTAHWDVASSATKTGSHSHSHSHSHASHSHGTGDIDYSDDDHDSHEGHSHSEGAHERERSLIRLCIAVTGLLMLVEIVVGYLFNSLALVADSYHMLNDLVAFIIQLYATQLMELKREGSASVTGFSYGFGRTQFIANLVSGTMLLALCLTLTLESLQRLYSPKIMTMPPLILGVGALALVWNVVMMGLFSSAHAGHSHSHGGHSHSFGHEDGYAFALHPHSYRQAAASAGRSSLYNLLRDAAPSRSSVQRSISKKRLDLGASGRRQRTTQQQHDSFSVIAHHRGDDQVRTAKVGLSALAVHALADAIGNVAIVIDGAASWCFGPVSGIVSGRIAHFDGIGYVDPICALVVVWIILKHAFPLVSSSSYALMQAAEPLRINRFRRELEKPDARWVPAHLRPHFRVKCEDLHVWSLSAEVGFATVKLSVEPKDGHASLSPQDLDHLIYDVKLLVFNNLDVAETAEMCIPPSNIGMDKLPYDVLEEVFQLAVGQDKCHGGEVYRWASHEEAYSLALVCRAWMAPARRVLYSSVSIFTPAQATLFLRTLADRPHLSQHTRALVVTLDEEEEVEGEAPQDAEQRHVLESEQLTEVVRACGSLERLQARTVHPRAAWAFLEAIVRQPRIKTFVGGPRPVDYRAHSWHTTIFNDPVPLLFPTLLNFELSSPFGAATRPSPILVFPKLEAARLVCEIPEDTICAFIKATSSTLSSMDVYQERLLPIDFMADGLRHQFPTMRHLKFRVNPSITDLENSFQCSVTPLFDRLFKMEPGYQCLETLSVAATDVSCEALRHLPPTLRHLEVSSFSDFSLFTFSERLLEVLRDSSIDFRLEKLVIRDEMDSWGDESNMELMEAACRARGIVFEFLAEDD